jgi:hypothetical protein
MIIYHLYAERGYSGDYGQTEFGYFKHLDMAKKVRRVEFKKARKHSGNTEGYKVDGYFKKDWHLEEIEVIE